MKIKPATLGVLCSAVCLGVIFGGAARAQDAAPASAAPARQARTVPIATALTSLTRASGISIVADRTVANSQVPMPASGVTPETVEDAIAEVVKSLPSGTVWAKLYLPLPKSGRFDGDAVADYALAQAKLYGTIGGSTAPGTIEVMGQRVPAEQAPGVIAALNLKPVYVITNANARNSPDGGANANWANMSPEQRQQYAQNEAQRLMNMDPQSRQQYVEQQASVMMTMMQMMTPEQRQQFMQGMRGAMGGGPGGPGGPGGRGGRPGRP